MSIDSVGVRSGRQRSNSAVVTGPIVLGPNDSLSGTLRTDSGVTVHGAVDGEIFAAGDVVIESTATVVAAIEGRNIDIRGHVKGNVTSSKRLSLTGSGSLQGDASATRLKVDDGATLNGSISMSGSKDVDHAEEPELAEFVVDAQANGDLVPAGEHEHSG